MSIKPGMLLRINKGASPKSKKGKHAYAYFCHHPKSLAFVLKQVKGNKYLISELRGFQKKDAKPVKIGNRVYYTNYHYFIISELFIFDNVYYDFPDRDFWMQLYIEQYYKNVNRSRIMQNKPYHHNHNEIDFADESSAYYAIKYPYRGF